MIPISALLGAFTLLLGRQLFWLFVAAAGFVLGYNVATRIVPGNSAILTLGLSVAAGVVGALLTLFAQRLTLTLAGFIAGGYFLFGLLDLLGFTGGSGFSTLLLVAVFLVGGVMGAGLVSILFEVALIVLSSALGATLLVQVARSLLDLGRPLAVGLFVLLLAIGLGAQWGAWQRQARRHTDG